MNMFDGTSLERKFCLLFQKNDLAITARWECTLEMKSWKKCYKDAEKLNELGYRTMILQEHSLELNYFLRRNTLLGLDRFVS